MRYIELNPVRASMVGHPADYRWCSYSCNAEGKFGLNDNWLVPHGEYLRLGQTSIERQNVYQQLFMTELDNSDLVQI